MASSHAPMSPPSPSDQSAPVVMAWRRFALRSAIMLLSLIPAFMIARYLDDDFPRLIADLSLGEAAWLFACLGKWSIALGALAYLGAYAWIGSPLRVRGQFGLLLLCLGVWAVGPLTLGDVAWVGGPWGAVMTVYPSLHSDMVPLFGLCAAAFYVVYMLAFVVVREPPLPGEKA